MKLLAIHPRHRGAPAFTLIEISLVMGLLIGLTVIMGSGIISMQRWEKGKDAAIALQAVYASQRAYMADHPTANIATVTTAKLMPYLPQGWSAFPTSTGINGEALVADHSIMPPKWRSGTGVYDPSGNSDDGLWDVGE